MTIDKLRSYKFPGGFAVFDIVAAFIFTEILFLLAHCAYFKTLPTWPFALAAFLLFIPIGIFFHVLFGVKTRLNFLLKLSGSPTV